MSEEGSILSSVCVDDGLSVETAVAAVSSCIFANYQTGDSFDISMLLLKLENGIFGIATTGRGYLMIVYGRTVPIGLLRGRLDALSKYFSRIFDQVK